MNKKALTEADIRTKFITPALEAAGWDRLTHCSTCRRIVAQVEKLMALVNRLDARLAVSRESAEKLLEAVVAELSRAAAGVVPEKASPRPATVK
jgi:hypothetical protein